MNLRKITSLAIAAIVLLCSISLVSCKTKLVYNDGSFYCAKNRVTYKEVDFQYTPVSINTEKYGELDENGKKTDIFSIENASPEKWLATADGRLFCAEEEDIPTLDEMSVNKILICREGNGLTVSLAEITSVESIKKVLTSMSGGVTVEYPEKGEAAELLTLSFSSSDHPWLYYNVSYIEFEADVCITDYVSDLSSYEERVIDKSVKKTVSSAFDCWYKLESDEMYEKFSEISNKTDIPCATVTKVNSEGGTDDYVGLLFSDETSVEECIQTVIELYEGEMSVEELRTLMADPDLVESNTVIEYNYGKYLVYDRATGKCVKAPEILHEYKELTKHD